MCKCTHLLDDDDSYSHFSLFLLFLDSKTQRQTGREAQIGNIQAARAVANIIRTTLGPRSMLKMLLDPMGSVLLTNDGHAILREVDVSHPTAKSMIELSRAQDEQVGDGTTSVIVLAAEVLGQAEPFLRNGETSHVHPTVLVSAYHKALAKALELLNEQAVEINVQTDKELVKSLIQSTLGTNSPSHKVFAAFSKYGLISVRYPPTAQTSTYCFLEFPDQSTAMACLLDCQGICVIDSIELTLKWATNTSGNNKRSKNNNDPEQQQQLHYMTLADAADSKTLYFHPPKGTDNDDHFSNALCKYLQQTLEEALNEGNEEERITAETEPALQVQVRRKEQYGFLEFASHAAATMGLAAVTQSTDGGIVQESTTNKPPQPAYLVGATLRWAKGEPPKSQRQQLLEALGLERQFFEKDSRTDCWFCLASPTCETHLITGVYQDWYATMPKGPVHPGHVLLVPVKHTMQGAWTLHDSALEEWNQLLDKLADHASDAYDSDLFIFERAMETRGGYHSHVNVVPIPRTNDTPLQLQTTMMAHAKASGFHLRTIESDLGMSALIRGDRGDEAQYFYAEIRTRQRSHRFLYQHLEENGSRNSRSSVPLQFAREVLAAVLNNPKLAHWKSCVLDTEQEGQLAKDFRDSFKATTGA